MANNNNSKISGVDVAAIVEILGIRTDLITSVGKVPVSSLTGWPVTTTTTTQGGSSCDPVTYGFDPLMPYNSCRAQPQVFAQDPTNQFLYGLGQCGTQYAPNGFYSDGRTIYRWTSEIGAWIPYDTCGPR